MNDDERRAKNAKQQREWRAANRARSREINRESAKRSRDADPDGTRERNREAMRAWRAVNPEKSREADRRWREANPEKSREKQKRWRECHPEKVAKRNAAYSEEKKKRRKEDPTWAQEQRDRSTEWAQQNPEKVMESYKGRRGIFANVLRDQLKGMRRRAHKAGIDFDNALFDQITPDTVPSCCQACDVAFEILPPQPGGGRRINLRALSCDRVDNAKGYFLANIGYLCFSCNARKKDATVVELEMLVVYMKRHFARHQ